MEANRLAAVTAVLTAIITAIVTLAGTVESDTAKAVIIVGSLFLVAVVVVVFLLGSQKHEERTGAGLAELGAVIFSGAPEDEADDDDKLDDVKLTDDELPHNTGADAADPPPESIPEVPQQDTPGTSDHS